MGRNLMKLSLFVGIGECHFEAPESLIVPDLLQLYPHPWGLCCLRAAHSSCPLQPTPTCQFSLRSSLPCRLSLSFTPPAPSPSACTHSSPSQPEKATRWKQSTQDDLTQDQEKYLFCLTQIKTKQMSKRDEHVSDERTTTKMQEKPLMKQR